MRAKEKERATVDSKELDEHSLVNKKHTILNGGQKKILLGGPKERKVRKASQTAMKAFRNQKKAQARISSSIQGEVEDQRGKGKEGAYPQAGLWCISFCHPHLTTITRCTAAWAQASGLERKIWFVFISCIFWLIRYPRSPFAVVGFLV